MEVPSVFTLESTSIVNLPSTTVEQQRFIVFTFKSVHKVHYIAVQSAYFSITSGALFHSGIIIDPPFD